MPIDPLYLVYGAIFLTVFFLVEGLYYFLGRGATGRKNVNRRMRMLADDADTKNVLASLRRAEENRWEHLGVLGIALFRLDRMVTQSGLAIDLKKMLLIMAGVGVALFFGLVVLAARSPVVPFGLSTLLLAALVALVMGVIGPIAYLAVLKTSRLKKFGEQLPDALDMMVRSLRAGHPVNIAMGMVATQTADPMGTEIGIAVDEMTYGLELREALANVSDRVDLPDFNYVVVAISIQHDTGGNLAEVLGGLAAVIRSRFRMFKKVRALSAEGKFSAKMLSALPFAFAAMVYSTRPNYYLDVLDDPLFFKVMGGAVVLQILGMIIMRKLINFKI